MVREIIRSIIKFICQIRGEWLSFHFVACGKYREIFVWGNQEVEKKAKANFKKRG